MTGNDKKKIFLALIIGSLLTANLTMAAEQKADLQQAAVALEEGVREAGATLREFNVVGWGEVGLNDPGEVSPLLDQLWHNLGGLEASHLEDQQGDWLKYVVTGPAAGGFDLQVTVDGQPTPDPDGGAGLYYLVICASGTGGDQGSSLAALDDRVSQTLASLSGLKNSRQALSLTATVPGRLDAKGNQELVNKVFRHLRARQIEGMSDEQLVSCSGYSSNIPGSWEVGGRPVNLQAAVRYHENDDLTYLHLGSPLLMNEY